MAESLHGKAAAAGALWEATRRGCFVKTSGRVRKGALVAAKGSKMFAFAAPAAGMCANGRKIIYFFPKVGYNKTVSDKISGQNKRKMNFYKEFTIWL